MDDFLPVSPTRMRAFLAVVDTGSVRSAAARLHVTEPAVSTAVTQLGRQLGVELFGRAGRGLRLTSAGEVYADYCRRILGLMGQAHAAVQRTDAGRLRIGAVATASEVVLPPILAGFRRRFPEITLSLHVAARDELFDQLRHHETDVVLGGRPPDGSGLAVRARRANSLVVVGAPGSGPADPSRATWLLRSRGSGLRATTESLLEQLGLDPPRLVLGTHGAVIASARVGLGITLLHADAVAADLAAGRLEVLTVRGTPLDRPWVVATGPHPPPAAELFCAHLTDPEQMATDLFHPTDRPEG